MYTNKLRKHRPTDTHSHIYTKPPSGQGLTLTLKGLCLAPVITTPQAGYVVCVSATLCVYETTMYGVNSCRHPRHAELNIARFVCARVLWFVFVWTAAVSATMHRDTEQLCLCWYLFEAVGRQEMRSCWGLWLCARGAYRRAGPGAGGEYQSLISQPRRVYGNEEQFIQCNVLKLGGISGYAERCHLSLHLFTPHLIQNLPLCYKDSLWNDSYRSIGQPFITQNSLFPHTSHAFQLISHQVRVHRGYRLKQSPYCQNCLLSTITWFRHN